MKRLLLPVALSLFLAACQSAEEKAEAYFQTATQRAADGDVTGAVLDLRNALELDDQHLDARRLYAAILLEGGEVSAAFRQYRHVSEAAPDDLDAIRALAGIAFDSNDPEAAMSYLEKGLALDPSDAGLAAIRVGLDYRVASQKNDKAAMAAAAEEARSLIKVDQALIRARRVAVAGAIRDGAPKDALTLIDAGLELDPDDRGLLNTKLVALNEVGGTDEIEALILNMVALYPEDARTQRLLIDWYLARGRIDEAEAWLAGRIEPGSSDPLPRMIYLRFLSQVRSNEVMRDELAALLVADPLPKDVAENVDAFRALAAGADYVAGETDKAISSLRALLTDKEPSLRIDRIKMQLAVMLQETRDHDGAMALVNEVLEHDPGQLQAIKLRAAHLLSIDQTDEATLVLRAALSDAPEDPELFDLLARVYQRGGKPVLVSDMLARAVEASQNAPKESLRYAEHLMAQDERRGALKVLDQALFRSPRDPNLLAAATTLNIALRDWPRAQAGIEALRAQSADHAATATQLQTQLYLAQQKTTELGALLEEVDTGEGDLAAQMAILRGYILAGEVERAAQKVAQLKADFPLAPEPNFAAAMMALDAGEFDDATVQLTQITESHPHMEAAWLALHRLMRRNGDETGAATLASRGFEANKQSLKLGILHARGLEASGDVEGAIAVYDGLYGTHGDDLILANNLASLLSAYRTDAESHARAFRIARRLEGSDEPAFLDTFGWAAHLAGQKESALIALRRAASELPEVPEVRYHFGVALASSGHSEAARTELEATLNLLRNSPEPRATLASDAAAALAKLAQ